jgi:hypothetical protein
MSTESSGSQGMGGSNGAGWLAALIGIWVLITPFFWGATGSGGGWWGGGGAWLYWSNIISGIVIAILAGYAAQSGNSGASWLAALVGIWVLITPFFWGLAVGGGINWWAAQGVWLYWSNIIAGIVVAILAGYTAQSGSAGSESSAAA